MYHNAGLAGAGGSSYIDAVILRDRDANTAWESQADGTLEERIYYCQNWRADVIALMTDSGELINQVRYDPYGVPFGIAKADLDADGDVDAADYTQFSTYYSAGTMPYADWNWDGTKDTADITAYLNDKNADAGLGRGDPSYAYGTEGGANRKAYAGYEIDPVLTGSEGWESVYHVRNRVYLSQAGRWTKRDPLGYVDGMNVYRYAGGSSLQSRDLHGLRPIQYPGDPRDGGVGGGDVGCGIGGVVIAGITDGCGGGSGGKCEPLNYQSCNIAPGTYTSYSFDCDDPVDKANAIAAFMNKLGCNEALCDGECPTEVGRARECAGSDLWSTINDDGDLSLVDTGDNICYYKLVVTGDGDVKLRSKDCKCIDAGPV